MTFPWRSPLDPPLSELMADLERGRTLTDLDVRPADEVFDELLDMDDEVEDI